ncbi:LUD domain-containing protein [Halogeometricum sp. S1BR25-6]|uniref:LUD domain-containing protein n=1 Tax=Halogeometricum salsisoli TaxID=2950536 RepID=A0ABU2GII1_9EURY|nr:LUD domain-containing protein [Halogeometricum sp. S1BR25-6]MDS0300622.1 LUD domain-containing protein [Halogeometricum sp. S1BR25-6]
MSAATLSRFESALKELDVTVSRVGREEFRAHVEEVVRPHAVGVDLTETFDDPALSLEETSVEVDPAPATLREAKTGVTGATLGIADYGSVVLTATDRASELASLFVERHVAVIRAEDVEADMASAVDALGIQLRETGGSAVIATGPSSTADMGALVKGAHGPREVHVVVVEEK